MSKKPASSFDDTRQYKNDRDSKKEVKEYCSTCGEVHGRECPEYYKVIQLDSILHGEEPKPECDHIVGVTGWVDSYCYDGDKVSLSELLKNDTMTRNLYDLEDIKERFYFCHKKGCGQAIDWEEIETKLNTTK